MKTGLLVFVLCVALLPVGLAQARPAPGTESIIRALAPATKVPPEWDGIWSRTDSVYDCTGSLQSTSTGLDTLCGGKDIPSPVGINYTCTGTADATSIHMTCTYDYTPFPDCTGHSESVIDATITGGTYYSVTRSNTSYSGTGFGCNLLPPVCTVIHVHATRTGAAPAAYCASATVPTNWGRIKELYR